MFQCLLVTLLIYVCLSVLHGPRASPLASLTALPTCWLCEGEHAQFLGIPKVLSNEHAMPAMASFSSRFQPHTCSWLQMTQKLNFQNLSAEKHHLWQGASPATSRLTSVDCSGCSIAGRHSLDSPSGLDKVGWRDLARSNSSIFDWNELR